MYHDCIKTYETVPCQDAEDADDYGLPHAYSHLRIFIHFFTRHSYFPYLAPPRIPTLRSPSSAPLLSPFCGDPTSPGRATSPRASRNVSLLRCADTPSPLRRCVPENSRRTHPRHGTYGTACSRRYRTRHDTRPQVWLEASASLVMSSASPTCARFLVPRTYTVLSFVHPSRSLSQSRLAHAAADGDDHLVVVTCLAVAYVRADTPASWMFVSFSTSPPLGSVLAHTPRSPPVSPNYAVCSPPNCALVHPLAPDHRRRDVLRVSSPVSPFLLLPGSRQPTSSSSSSWRICNSTRARARRALPGLEDMVRRGPADIDHPDLDVHRLTDTSTPSWPPPSPARSPPTPNAPSSPPPLPGCVHASSCPLSFGVAGLRCPSERACKGVAAASGGAVR
ncbi:hypothetical protein K466DRAFT_724 [Polyporus arcularius HHB13444]|uniref:Uncharacterized protein n=1 Tax=Polyporus arcularius HHB13444 TaxID=1314778 RepID=A0A5C3Q1E6_9APHY|nr:hypothetical protein K466DRAFT_724 [Polyporus arcularius HHB13444]